MYSTIPPLLVLLLVSLTNAIDLSNPHDGGAIQRRVVIPKISPPKSPRPETEPDSPSIPRVVSPGVEPFDPAPGSVKSPTYKSPTAEQYSNTIETNPNQYYNGKATESLDPCKTGNECTEMLLQAADVVRNIMDTVQKLIDDGSSSNSTSIDIETSSSTSSLSSSTATPSNTARRPILNANMSSWMDLKRYTYELTTDEFAMARESPVCFFANMEALYEGYASYAAQESITSTSQAPASSTSDPAADLYISYLPSQIRMVYTSTPTSLSVSATATTSCSSLYENGTFVVTYGLFGYKAGYSPTAAAATTTFTQGPGLTGSSTKNRITMKLCGAAGVVLFGWMVLL